jgi:hypothetical protein
MKIFNTVTLILVAFLVLMATRLSAQVSPLTASERQLVIDSISGKLNANYVFPEVAQNMAASIQTKLKNGEYDNINDPEQFGTKLTEDLQAISKDKHLRVRFAPQQIAEQNQVVTPEDSIASMHGFIRRMKRNNFGFKEVKIMGGNVGYLDLRSFSNVEFAGETAVAAMNFLSNTDAIIIDLRNNGGGSPQMIQLISSYLFGSDPVHLNNFYWRPTDSNTQTWTLPHVSGTRSPDTPVYVLTSSDTFSAAEEFSYNLKNLERATLVGETTGGGAHPGGSEIATDRFMIWLPTGRAINPITNSNWEGTGVSPHIEVPARDALGVAYIKALEELKKKNTDKDMAVYYDWHMAEPKLKQSPVTLDPKVLKRFAGTYGPRKVTLENGTLFYQRGSGNKYELFPYGENKFMLKGLPSFRIQFLSENNKVVALQGLYDNGHTDKNLRD